ncbi:hypothetical protein [Streptosporangium brasiliense]|uniref:hypothetical protein n=1 Tax=Streptosporangium brasiliense TaxID=47480 RepID=UPI00351F9C0F
MPLDDPLGSLWPEVAGHPLGHATARHLLTHTAGMPLRANLKHLYGTDPRAVRDGVLREELHRPIQDDRAGVTAGQRAGPGQRDSSLARRSRKSRTAGSVLRVDAWV